MSDKSLHSPIFLLRAKPLISPATKGKGIDHVVFVSQKSHGPVDRRSETLMKCSRLHIHNFKPTASTMEAGMAHI